MTTTTTLARITTDIARWLDRHATHDLPPLCHLSVSATITRFSTPALQIDAGPEKLHSLAAWAAHLDTHVDLMSHLGFIEASITSDRLPHQLHLWTHLDGAERAALETHLDADEAEYGTAAVATLREAASTLVA